MITIKLILVLFLFFSSSLPLVNNTTEDPELPAKFYWDGTSNYNEAYFTYLMNSYLMISRGNPKEKRTKRNVVNLYYMIACKTNCNGFDYNGYGCYCGLLGSGEPVDEIDRCCQEHDRCYDNSRCSSVFLYAIPYFWKCYNNEAYCNYAGENNCFRTICECDKEFVKCLHRYPCPKQRASCTSSYWGYY